MTDGQTTSERFTIPSWGSRRLAGTGTTEPIVLRFMAEDAVASAAN